MITMLIAAILMFLVTLTIQYCLFKFKKKLDWWSDSALLIAIAVLGLVTLSPTYFAILLGHVLADETAKFIGWR